MSAGYSIIRRAAEADIEVRKSRFLATVARASDEASARTVIEQCRRNHREARHHCSAFVVGPHAEYSRSSDDGEPAGSAGMPILETIRGRGLSDVVIVVTRWFGGIKLGTGGLARAYADAANAGLDAAGRAQRQLLQRAITLVDLDRIGRIENRLRSRPATLELGLTIEDIGYGQHARVALSAPLADWPNAAALLAELGLAVELADRYWRDVP